MFIYIVYTSLYIYIHICICLLSYITVTSNYRDGIERCENSTASYQAHSDLKPEPRNPENQTLNATALEPLNPNSEPLPNPKP